MKKLVRKSISLFIQGLLALLPFIVCGYILLFLIGIINNITDSFLIVIPKDFRYNQLIRFIVKVFSLSCLGGGITFFGILIKTLIGRTLLKRLESIFEAIPGLNTIYKSTKQVVEIIGSGKKQFFTQPVLIEWPSSGRWAVAFNTGKTRDIFNIDGKQHHTIFIPTTPNPTSGFLAVVTDDKIKPLDISVEEAIQMILTGGIVKKKEDKNIQSTVIFDEKR